MADKKTKLRILIECELNETELNNPNEDGDPGVRTESYLHRLKKELIQTVEGFSAIRVPEFDPNFKITINDSTEGITEITQRYMDGFMTKDEHSDMIVNLLYEKQLIK